MGGAASIGALARAGTRLGGGNARLAVGWHYIGLNIQSPIANKPWRFYAAYMTGPPMDHPLGTEKSIITVNWRAIPYAVDPWNSGSGAAGVALWDHDLDT